MADGISKQVMADIVELGKSTARAGVQAASDIAGGTVETLVTGGLVSNTNDVSKTNSIEKTAENDPMMIMRQQNEAKRRQALNRVRGELEAYRQRRTRAQQVETQKKQQDAVVEQQKKSAKARQDQDFLARLKRTYGGSHEGDNKALG